MIRSSHRRTSQDDDNTKQRLVKLLYLVVVASWICSLSLAGTSQQVIRKTLRILDKRGDYQRYQTTLHDLQDQQIEMTERIETLQQTNHLLQHEVRLLEEFADGELSMSPTPNHHELIQGWLDHRHEGMKQRTLQLQHYVQEWSKQQTVDRYVSW